MAASQLEKANPANAENRNAVGIKLPIAMLKSIIRRRFGEKKNTKKTTRKKKRAVVWGEGGATKSQPKILLQARCREASSPQVL